MIMKKKEGRIFFTVSSIPTKARAEVVMTEEEKALVSISEIVIQDEFSDEEISQLESDLATLEIDSASYFTLEDYENPKMARGYGQVHELGQGWKARVDRPGAGEGKPHIHVYKGKVEGIENVDGTASHGKNLDSAGVPKSIQKKAKDLKDYKKGQEDLKKIKDASKKIDAKNLNLHKTADIIIAIAIFVAVVGLVIFATGAIASWGAFLLLI